jgi:hypothetical protein
MLFILFALGVIGLFLKHIARSLGVRRKMKIYLAIAISRGLFSWVKAFRYKANWRCFAEKWAQENSFPSYDEFLRIIEEEGTEGMDDVLQLEEIDLQ